MEKKHIRQKKNTKIMSRIGLEPIFMAHETIELPITPSKKNSIQQQVPLPLPCYDFALVTILMVK